MRYSIIAVFLLVSSVSSAQGFNKKWTILLDLPDKIVYMDTSDINLRNNNLFVWTLTNYREPAELAKAARPVSKSISHYRINIATKRYAEIGNLNYDITGKQIQDNGFTSLPGAPTNLTIPVKPGSNMEILKDKALEYLETGRIIPVESTYEIDTTNVNPDTAAVDIAADNNQPADEDTTINPQQMDDDEEDDVTDGSGIGIVPPVDVTPTIDIPEADNETNDENTDENDEMNDDNTKEEDVITEPEGVDMKPDFVEPQDTLTGKDIKERIEQQNDSSGQMNDTNDDTTLEEQNEVKIPIEPEDENSVKENETTNDDKLDYPGEEKAPDNNKQNLVDVNDNFDLVYDPILDSYVPRNQKSIPTRTVEKESSPVKDNNASGSRSTGNYNEDNDKHVGDLIFTDGNNYVIQVASFRTRSAAEKLMNELKNKGHNAFISQMFVSGKNATYNRVRVGYFDSKSEALNYKPRIGKL